MVVITTGALVVLIRVVLAVVDAGVVDSTGFAVVVEIGFSLVCCVTAGVQVGTAAVDDGAKSITIGSKGDFGEDGIIEFGEAFSKLMAFGERVGPGLFNANDKILFAKSCSTCVSVFGVVLLAVLCNNEFRKARSLNVVPNAFCCCIFTNKSLGTSNEVVAGRGAAVVPAVAAVVTCDTIFAAAPVVTGAKVVVGAVVVGTIVVVVVVVGAIVVVVVVGAIVVVVVVGAIVVVVVGTVVVVVGAAVVTEAAVAVAIGAAVVVSTWLDKARLALGIPIVLEYGVNTSTNGFTGRANRPLSPESSSMLDATEAVITGEAVVIPKI